ncbi:hypothetical protein GS504_00845 [Rhodococcus hoagii]|nr:hypothetical protein [Prescottella equi]NKS72210.1 hypothetical protein [Prescottella equi]
MATLLDVLQQMPAAGGVPLPTLVADLLRSIEPHGPTPVDILPIQGSATAGGALVPGGFGATLSGEVSWNLTQAPNPGDGFALGLSGGIAGAGVPAPGVEAATRTDLVGTNPARAELTSTGAPVTVAFAGAITIAGSSTRGVSITPGTDAHAAVSAEHLLLPSGIGMSLHNTEVPLTADGPSFGAVEFVLPSMLPIVGGLVLPATLTPSLAGTDITVTVPRTPATGSGVNLSGTLNFRLCPDTVLADLVPLALSLVLELPGGGRPLGDSGPQIGETLRVRATASRPPADPAALSIAVSAESDGAEGLVHVEEGAGAAEVAAGVTTVLGQAMAARAGTVGLAALGAIFGAAEAFAPRFASRGGMVLHGVTLQASPASTEVPVLLDIEGSVEGPVEQSPAEGPVQNGPWTAGPLLSIWMDRPMRVRWRNVRAVVDVTKTDAIRLDLQGARQDVVDPGGWKVRGPGDLFEVIGTRGGSGSTWFEVDLRFTVDLGPVRVSGATIRATWAGDSVTPEIGLRGLDASVDLPGVLRGGGKVAIAEKLDVALWAQIVPLRVNGFVDASIGGGQVVLTAGVDLPAPVLVGPTGLGLYSLSATIGTNSGVHLTDAADPMKSLRQWRPWNGLDPSPGNLTLGAVVVVATAADDGFSANTLGIVGVTVPDFALRIGLDAAFLKTRRRLTEENEISEHTDSPPADGLVVVGGLSASGNGLDVGLEGGLRIPHLLEVHIPAAGHFTSNGWFVHVGSDDGIGGKRTDRPPGPMKATVFPGLGPLEVKDAGWAFLMIRGNGVDHLAGTDVDLYGFAVAAGIGFSQVFGVEPVLWAKVSASLVAAISTRPMTLWVQGRLDGSVGLGPFRIGVAARATIDVTEEQIDLHFKVCAVVDLLFVDLEGCIEIGTETTQLDTPPLPDPWPVPLVTLADGIGRLLTDPKDPNAGHLVAEGGDTPSGGWSSTPTVWPDTIPLLTFPIAPVVDSGAGVRDEIHAGLSGSGRFQHEWHLTQVLLEKVTAAGTTAVAVDTASAWQVPVDVSADAPPATTSDLRQLALLTVQRGLTLVHQAAPPDGSIPPSVSQAAGLCHWNPGPGMAWTFGEDARRLPEPHSWRAPERSTLLGFPTSLAAFTRGVGFDVVSPADDLGNLLANVTATGWVDEGGTVWFDAPITVDDASFAGGLRLWGRTSACLEKEPPTANHTIAFDEPVSHGYLLIDSGPNLREEAPFTATVTTVDGNPRPAPPEPVEGQPGMWRVPVAHHGTDARAIAVQLEAMRLCPLAIVGLNSIAGSMDDGAIASKAKADALSNLPINTLVDGSGRLVLDAGSQYRITVTLGYANRVDGKTATQLADTRVNRWFFRTAGKDPKAKAAETGGPAAADATPWDKDTVVAPWRSGALAGAKAGIALVDRFDPGFLSRYLTGYTPADHEQFHFTGDPVSATFRAPYIAQFAKQMGRGIGLAARRTDLTTSTHAFLLPDPSGVMLANGVHGQGISTSDLLGPAARQLGCLTPSDGAQIAAAFPLEPRTPYELSVGLPLTGATFKPGDPELDGITFITSAYRGPEELIEAFNLHADVGDLALAPTSHGDLALGPGGDGSSVALAGLADGSVSDDAQLEQVLAQLGVPPLRAVTEPRSTVLWALSAAGQWSVAGLLLESPEPLSRPGRMELLNADIGGTNFPVLRTSRTATRTLWLLHDPANLTTPTGLTVRAANGTTQFTRQLRVDPRPRFTLGAIKAAGQ